MKVSDYIARYLHEQGVKVVFELIGGMITHLIDSIYRAGEIDIVSMHHEQGAGFAAEAVGRMTGIPGVALATSGPGATNLVTPIASCYFDSVPAVFITGQVNTTELSEGRSIRQQGFQETDIVSIVKPITKGAWMVREPADIPAMFSRAFELAMSDRPGPVLLDLPMNVQRMEIEEAAIERAGVRRSNREIPAGFIASAVNAIRAAQRPMLIAGGGVRNANAIEGFRSVVDRFGIPVAQTLMGLDTLDYSHPLRIGMMGTYGNRWVNQAIMQSDCLWVLGARLDVRQTGSDTAGFKGTRPIFHVDCDEGQINNRVRGCIPCVTHLKDFFAEVDEYLQDCAPLDCGAWRESIAGMRRASPDTGELNDCPGINPNIFLHRLSQRGKCAGAIAVDVGKNQMWAGQSMEIGAQQRMLMSGGLGSMGFGLPAAIGCAFTSDKPVIAVVGDGGFQCNIQELEVVASHKLAVKTVIFNNRSLGMVGQFQNEYFDARMRSTVWGYSAPDFEAVGKAYRIASRTISSVNEMDDALEWLWKNPEEPQILVVMIDVDTKVLPKVSFGRSIDDMDPRKGQD